MLNKNNRVILKHKDNRIIFKHNKQNTDRFNENELPYIAVYNFEPSLDISEDLKVDYYVTDFNQKEYLMEDYSQKFTVEYSVVTLPDNAGNVTTLYLNTINNVIPGDNTFTISNYDLGGEGEKILIVRAIENGTNRETHEFVKEFRVIDKAKMEADILNNTYYMTDKDLIDYNISNQNSIDAVINTRDGLQKLLNDKASEGVRKLIMLPGIYLLYKSHKPESLSVPNNFTLDLNGATIKQHVFKGAETTSDINILIKIENKFDSHITNGVIVGDLVERNPQYSADGEFAFAINIFGGKYCSLSNLEIKDNAGYTVLWGIEGAIGGGAISGWSDVDIKNGTDIKSTTRSTSDYLLLNQSIYNSRLACVGEYLGYQGVFSEYQMCHIHFYNSNKEYICTKTSYQYRKFFIPKDASYVRVTLFCPIDESMEITVMKLLNYNFPTNLNVKNINFKNTRTCALAPQGSSGVIVENCTFDDCGYAFPTPSAIDFEDGWDLTQDVLLKNCEIIKSRSTSDIIVCGGNNYQFEGLLNFSLLMNASDWYRPKGYVVKNCNLNYSNFQKYGKQQRGSWAVVRKNNFYSSAKCTAINEKKYSAVVENNFYKGCSITSDLGAYSKAIRCYFEDDEGKDFSHINSTTSSIKSMKYIDCYLNNIYWQLNSDVKFENCKSDNPVKFRFGTNSGARIFENCVFDNSLFLVSNSAGSGLFNGCTFDSFALDISGQNTEETPIIFESCTINWKDFNTLGLFRSTATSFYIRFVNCTINDDSSKPLVQHSKSGIIQGKITFDNCAINKAQGVLVQDNYTHAEGTDLNIHLINTPISIPIGNANVINNPNIWKVVIE